MIGVSGKPPLDWPNYEQPHATPLSDEEIIRVRQILMSDERSRWLMATIRIWAAWIAGVLLAVTVGYDFLKKALTALIKS